MTKSLQQRVRALPHALTESLGIAAKHLKECHRLLFSYDLLVFSGSLSFDHVNTLKHLSSRSLRFGKVGEFVTLKSLMGGVLSAWAPPSRVGRTVLIKHLQYLTERGFIIDATVHPMQTKLFVLNFPELLSQAAVVLTGTTQTYQKDWLERITALHGKYAFRLASAYDSFESPVFANTEDCIVQFAKAVKNMEAKKGKHKFDLAWLRTQSHAEAEDGTMANTVTAWKFLDVWASAASDAGYVLPAAGTSRVKGMAQNWMQEHANEGYQPAYYADMVEYIITNWKRIRSERITTSSGKEIKVLEIPTFEFFYNYRAQILARLYALDNPQRTVAKKRGGLTLLSGKERRQRTVRKVKLSGGL